MTKRFYIFFLFGAVLFAEACKNDDSVYKTAVFTEVNVVNAFSDTLNFYLNGTRQNNSSNLYPGGQSLYIPTQVGAENFQFKKAGAFNVLFNFPVTLQNTPNYSLYVAGESVDKSFSTIDTLLTDTVPNSTQIRFVNASPDAGSLNVFVGDTVNFKSRAFKTSSVFLPTGSGMKEVKIVQSGTVLIDTAIAFQPGGIYSLVSRSYSAGKAAKFTVSLVINHQN